MKELEQTHLSRSFEFIPQGASAFAVLVGILVLFGWWFEVTTLKSVLPGLVAMKANTAAGFVLAGISLWTANARRLVSRCVSLSCGAGVLLLGLAVLAEYLTGADFGIDQLLARDITTLPGDIPGRMAVSTAACFAALGAALMLLGREKGGASLAVHALAAMPLLVAGAGLVSYGYDLEAFLRIKLTYTPMALHTAVAFVVLCLGTVSARPDYPFRRILTSNTASGATVRRLLPAAIALQLLVGGLLLKFFEAGYLNEALGIALFAMVNIVGLGALIQWNALRLLRADAERRLTEEALRANEERLALSQEVAGIGSFDWDVATGHVVWTPALERLYGLEPGEYQGTYDDWFGRIHPEDQAVAEESVRQAIAQRREWRVEYRIVRKEGSIRWIFGLGRPLFDEANHFVRFLGVNLDITQSKELEEARQRSERVLRTILEHVPVGIGLFDGEGNLLQYNPELERIWGGVIPVGEVQYGEYKAWWAENGKPVEAHEWASVRAVERGQTSLNEVLDVQALDGVRRSVLNSAVPVRDAEGQITGVVVVLQDISEMQRAQRALRDANRELEQTLTRLRATQRQLIQSEKLAALGTLAAGVAHEMSNPLMGVMGFVSFARRLSKEPRTEKVLSDADRELKRMADLLKNILGFARPIDEQLVRSNISTLLQRALTLMQPDLKGLDIAPTVDVPPDLPPVLAKEGGLQQVFVNLLMNARDALEGRPVKMIHVGARRVANAVQVEVTDTGVGISPENQERIFDPFFTTKPPGKGTGLGLSIARNLLSELGGTIDCESREGEGSTFTVRLPMADNADSERQTDAKTNPGH